MIEIEPRFLAKIGLEVLTLDVSLTTFTIFVLKVPSTCFVVSVKALFTTKVLELVVEEICANLRFRVFKIEPRAGSM